MRNAEQQAADFNQRYPVGSRVTLKVDFGEPKQTTVRHAAYVCPSGYPVAHFTGVLGYYLIGRVSDPAEAQDA